MGHIDVNRVSYTLPDGRPVLREVSLRVGDGAKIALVGPNGTGKTTLTRIVSGDLPAHDGAVTRSGNLGVMRQFVGSITDESTVRDLLVSVAPPTIQAAAAQVDRAELALMERDSEVDQMRLRPGSDRLGGRRRLRLRDAMGHLHRRGARGPL